MAPGIPAPNLHLTCISCVEGCRAHLRPRPSVLNERAWQRRRHFPAVNGQSRGDRNAAAGGMPQQQGAPPDLAAWSHACTVTHGDAGHRHGACAAAAADWAACGRAASQAHGGFVLLLLQATHEQRCFRLPSSNFSAPECWVWVPTPPMYRPVHE